MVNALESICLFVDDFDKSFDFYKNILELSVEIEDKNFAAFRLGELLLEVYLKEDGYLKMVPAKFMLKGVSGTFGFLVDDVDIFAQKLIAKGISIVAGPKSSEWGQRMVFFTDPDGYVWEAYTK